MKTIRRTICLLLANALILTSCQNNDEITTENGSSKLSKSNSLSMRSTDEEKVVVQYKNKEFSVNTEKIVGYSDEGVFQYNAILAHSEMNIEDNSLLTGEIIATNPKTDEKIIFYNIIEEKEQIVFDVKTSEGHVFEGMSAYNESATGRFPIRPVIKAIVYLGTAIGVLVSSNQSQASCQASLNSLHCPPGKSPYMTYESGWFTSSCSVGCH